MRLAAFCLSVAGLVLAASWAQAEPRWIEYRPDKVGFAVDMPGLWKESSQTEKIDDADVKSVSADISTGGNGYEVTYVVFPESLIRGRSTGDIVDRAIDDAVAATAGTLRKNEAIMVSGLPGRQFIIEAPGNVVLMARVIMFADTIVEIDVGGKKGVETDTTAIRFLSSLQVVGR